MAVKYLVSDKSGDHLPYTGDDGKPDHRLMGGAWAALHGGYRGNKYEGPNKAEAISKLTAMYKAESMGTPGSSGECARSRRSRTRIEGAKHNRTAKKNSAKGSFTLVALFVILLLLILLLQGFGIAGFKLSDHVLLATIGLITVCVRSR